jgi:hypothetical protein
VLSLKAKANKPCPNKTRL